MKKTKQLISALLIVSFFSQQGIVFATSDNGIQDAHVGNLAIDQTSIDAKDSTIYVGDFWQAEHNFISATDKDGKALTLYEIKVTGTVDTNLAGVYNITYDNNGVTKEISVTVLDLYEISAHNSDLNVGDSWQAVDNFDYAFDVRGNSIDFKDINVSGVVDTTKAGIYEVTYQIVPIFIPPFLVKTVGKTEAIATITVHENKANVEAKDSAIYVGDSWKIEDNFIAATDNAGNPVEFKDIKVSGTVDTTKAGTYAVTYEYDGVKQTITVTVLANQTSLNAKDSTIYVGDSWKAEDNFITATDNAGNPVEFKDIKVSGTVDTTKAGTYTITYEYSGVKKIITVNVLALESTITVHYQDEAGNSIASDKILTGAIGDSYNSEQMAINGYTFKEVQGNATGQFTDKNQVIVYIYSKNKEKVELGSNSKPNNSNQKTENGKNKPQANLPQAGERHDAILPIIGGFMLVGVFLFLAERKQINQLKSK